jgi:hypothetical protein
MAILKKYFLLLLFITPLMLLSCNRDMIIVNNESLNDDTRVYFRIKNSSNFDFSDVKFDPDNNPASYGSLSRGELSGYKSFPGVRNDFQVNVKINNIEFIHYGENQPGMPYLEAGRYTLNISVLSFTERKLLLTLISD